MGGVGGGEEGGIGFGEGDGEGGSDIFFALDGDGAVHGFDEAFGEGEADARALDALGFCVESVEGGEDTVHFGFGDTEAGVADDDTDGFWLWVLLEREGDVAFGAVVFDGVGEEVDEDLFKSLSVGECDGGWAVGRFDSDADVVTVGEGAEEVCGFEEERGEGDGDGLDGHATGFDASDVEHFVDEGEEVFSGFGDVIDAFDLFWVVCAEAEELGESEDGVEWGSELVAHSGEEVAFCAGGLFGARASVAELFFRFSAEDGAGEDVCEGLEEEGVVA